MRAELQRTGADALVIDMVSQTINDRQEERVMSGDYKGYVLTRICTMLDHQLRSSSVSGLSKKIQSDSMDNTDN